MKLQHQGVPKKGPENPGNPTRKPDHCHSSLPSTPRCFARKKSNKIKHICLSQTRISSNTGARVLSEQRKEEPDRTESTRRLPQGGGPKVVVGCKKTLSRQKRTSRFPHSICTQRRRINSPKKSTQTNSPLFPGNKKDNKKTVSSMVMRKQEPLIFPEPRQPKVFPICD